MFKQDRYKPIETFGYFLIAVGIWGIFVLFFELADVKYLIAVWTFIGSLSLYHLLLGLGVILRKKWVFSLFKGYLQILYFGFPVGTYLSRETMRYIEKNKIERYLK